MDVGLSARQARVRHRHELHTLTYVTLDQANGGIIRNISHEGIAVQLVAAVRPRQQMRVRFELRHPRLRVETRGEVVWATFSGQCGIRFLDLPPRMARQIDEWIFSNLLEGISLHSQLDPPAWDGRLQPRSSLDVRAENDGLIVSGDPVKVIELPLRHEPEHTSRGQARSRDRNNGVRPQPTAAEMPEPAPALDWLSQPLSGRSLAWTINLLAIVAGLLLFALIFLSVTRELPKWPFALTAGAAILVAALYWGFFKLFGGSSPGARLARLAGYHLEEEEEMKNARFR